MDDRKDKWWAQVSLELEVEGEYKPGDNYRVTPVTQSPPDPELYDITGIYLTANGKRVNIKDYLPEEIIAELEARYFEEIAGW